MIYKGLTLSNISEIIRFESVEVLSRFPDKLHKELGHTRGYQMTGSEIRLKPRGVVKITLGSLYSYTRPKAVVIYGENIESVEYDLSNEQVIIIDNSEKKVRNSLYSSDIVRIVLIGEMIYIKEVIGDIDLITEENTPAKKMMAYGTSITQGIGATQPEMSYPWLLARKLGFDCINYGMSGCAFIEEDTIEFLCQDTYDLIVLELSVNMWGEGFSAKEFGIKYKSLVLKLLDRNKDARIYSFSILPFFADLNGDSNADEYRSIHRGIIREIADPRLIYVDSRELISFNNLSSDLIHPSNIGMIEIADNLAKVMNQNEEQ